MKMFSVKDLMWYPVNVGPYRARHYFGIAWYGGPFKIRKPTRKRLAIVNRFKKYQLG